MSEIQIIEKPDSISYETIRDVLREAHKEHTDKGLVMIYHTLPAEELERMIGERGKCFVALDGDKVVGTASCRIKVYDKWYCKGEAWDEILLGVLPAYQGRHLSTRFNKIREEEAVKQGINIIAGDTAEQNTKRIAIAEKEGFIKVDYHWNNGHYSVELMKWLDGCPFSKKYCAFRFSCKRLKVRVRHNLGELKRKVIK